MQHITTSSNKLPRNCHSKSNKKQQQQPQQKQTHIYKKLKQTAVSFQQLRDNQEDDLSSSDSSSTFSSSSPQRSSLDYEAEDENEDKQRLRRHKDENDSLIHVQNFLKCFGANAFAGAAARTITTATARITTTPTAAAPATTKVVISPNAALRSWRQSYRTSNVTVTPTAAAAAAATTHQTHFTNSKPQKFQINTKFLRKPRNKLMKLLPTTATTTLTQQQQQQQQEAQQTQLFIDDSNAKFKDFSIDSLLNK